MMSSYHTIILRTVCGCERMLAIKERHLPDVWKVAYIKVPGALLTTDNQDLTTQAFTYRLFERTTLRGNYGYPIYLEKI